MRNLPPTRLREPPRRPQSSHRASGCHSGRQEGRLWIVWSNMSGAPCLIPAFHKVPHGAGVDRKLAATHVPRAPRYKPLIHEPRSGFDGPLTSHASPAGSNRAGLNPVVDAAGTSGTRPPWWKCSCAPFMAGRSDFCPATRPRQGICNLGRNVSPTRVHQSGCHLAGNRSAANYPGA
jgi:hypothetical protein